MAVGEPGPVERVPDRRRLVGPRVVHDHERGAPVPRRGHEHLPDKGHDPTATRARAVPVAAAMLMAATTPSSASAHR
jgi:hypothetical protein